MLVEPLLHGHKPPVPLCHAALALSHLLSCSGLIIIRLAMNEAPENYDSVNFIFWRFVGATPLLLVAVAATSGLPRLSWSEARTFLALGAGIVCNQLFVNLGVQLAGALLATCMQPSSAILAAALAVAVGQERPSIRVAVGLCLAVSGAVTIAAGRSKGGGPSGDSGALLLGMLCLVVHAAGWAGYIVGVKAVVSRYSSLAITGAAQAAGLAIMAGLVGLRQGCVPDAPGVALPRATLLPLLYWVVVVSGLCYVLTAWASRQLPASTVTLYATLQPGAGAALSVLLLGERLRWTDLGAVGVVAGLVVVARRPREDV